MSRNKYHQQDPGKRLRNLARAGRFRQKLSQYYKPVAVAIKTAKAAVAAIPQEIEFGQPATTIAAANAAAHTALDAAFAALDDAQAAWAEATWGTVVKRVNNTARGLEILLNLRRCRHLQEHYPAFLALLTSAEKMVQRATSFTPEQVRIENNLPPGAVKAVQVEAFEQLVWRTTGVVGFAWDVFNALEQIVNTMAQVENGDHLAALLLLPDFAAAQEAAAAAVEAVQGITSVRRLAKRRLDAQSKFEALCRDACMKATRLAELYTELCSNGGPPVSAVISGKTGDLFDRLGVSLHQLMQMSDAEITDINGIGATKLAEIRQVIPAPQQTMADAVNGGDLGSIAARAAITT